MVRIITQQDFLNAAQTGDHELIRDILLAKQPAQGVAAVESDLDVSEVDVNAVNRDGCTALHLAAINNSAEAIRELLGEVGRAAGINVNAVDYWGQTALHLAARNNQIVVIRELLGEAGRAAGINVNANNYEGWTALDLAARNNHVEAIRELLGEAGRAAGINVNNADYALLLAASNNSAAAIQELLGEAGKAAGINFIDVDYALLLAASNNSAAAIQELLGEAGRALGIDVNAVDVLGRTALHLAAMNGFTESVQALLANQEDKRARGVEPEGGGAAAVDTPDVTPSDPRVINVNARTKTPPRGREGF